MELPDQPFALFHEAVPIVHDLHECRKMLCQGPGLKNWNAGVNRKSQKKIVSRRMVLKNLQKSCDLINKHGDSMRMCESRNMCGFKKEFSHYRHLMDEVLPTIKKNSKKQERVSTCLTKQNKSGSIQSCRILGTNLAEYNPLLDLLKGLTKKSSIPQICGFPFGKLL